VVKLLAYISDKDLFAEFYRWVWLCSIPSSTAAVYRSPMYEFSEQTVGLGILSMVGLRIGLIGFVYDKV
jgi:hypothetical protein